MISKYHSSAELPTIGVSVGTSLVKVENDDGRLRLRYFGYGKGLTFYTWTSDQHSQYGDKVIPSTSTPTVGKFGQSIGLFNFSYECGGGVEYCLYALL